MSPTPPTPDLVWRITVLGFGAGEVSVKTGEANPQTFERTYVLFVWGNPALVQPLFQE